MLEAALEPSRSTPRRRPAASLSRYSFQLPHFGDCTHDGQPSSHGHAVTSSWAASTCSASARERELGDARAAGVAVVHEDRRLAGLRVHRHRHAADVPAVADREQRQQADQRVLGRVHRADHLRRLHAGREQRRRAAPCTSTRASTSSRGGKSSGTISMISLVDDRRRWYATSWCVTSTAPRCAAPRRRARACSSSCEDRDVGVLARAGCTRRASSAGCEHRDVAARCRAPRPGTGAPGAGTPRPGARPGTRGRRRRCRPARPSASTSWYSSDEPLRSPTPGAGGRRPTQYMRPPRDLQQVVEHELAHRVVEARRRTSARRRG